MMKSAKRILALAISGVTAMAAGGALLAPAGHAGMIAHAEETQQAEVPISAHSDEGIMPTSTCTPEKPELIKKKNDYASSPVYDIETYFESYNCFAAFPIKNMDVHAREIHLASSNSSYSATKLTGIGYGETGRYIQAANSGKYCYPNEYFVRAYCAACGSYSAMDASWLNDRTYGYNTQCEYGCTYMMSKGTIATDYDQADNKFKHGGSTNSIIYFSIAYKGEAAGSSADGINSSLSVPWIGYSSAKSLTIKGVTFTVRAGPTYISIKASIPVVCSDHETVFAYYVAK